MDIVLFGIQGSGKGTLGKAVSRQFDYNYFEMGGELRRLAQEDSELGKKIKSIIEAGHLVSNEIVIEIVDNFINTNTSSQNPIIFDGIPRQMEQAQLFEEVLKKHQRQFMGILVDVPEQEALRRLTTRRVCKSCKEVYPASYSGEKCSKCQGELITRSDDTPKSIKTRIEAYYAETMPVINKYEEEGRIIIIDGTPEINEATNNMIQAVESLKKDQ
jgi:adenylate kinase